MGCDCELGGVGFMVGRDATGILLGVLAGASVTGFGVGGRKVGTADIPVGAFVTGFDVGGGEVGAAVTGLGVLGFGVGFGVIMLSRLTAIPSAEPALAALIPKPSTRNVIDSPLKPNPYIRTPVGLTLPY